MTSSILSSNLNSTSAFYEDARIGINTKHSFLLLNVSEILYIEKIERHVRIYLKNDEYIDTSENLKAIELKLSKYEFYRPHKSFIVPLGDIREISSDHFMDSYNIHLIKSKTHIKLSKHKYKELRNILVTGCHINL
ncbi:LytTR family DNA-binding domain-containing protein [Exiguobacterium sp. s91]|uniref:LytR/AlgR family response regulator transcription factor n=1 Tax=Exiguobacterium TaxID=33986 RepID=UPI001BE65E80